MRWNPGYVMQVIFVVNLAISVLYLIWGIALKPSRKNKPTNSRTRYYIITIIMILCPVVGILFFSGSYLLFCFFFHGKVDLSDVIFSKERVVMHQKAEEEREINMVPLEEAIAISDKESLRRLMINVLKGDIQKSLAAIALALNSEDSETSHYAATVLRDELNDFRISVQKIYLEIKKEDKNRIAYAVMLLDYMNCVLEQKVFTDMEQQSYVYIMEEVGEILYQNNKQKMKNEYYEWICLRLLEIKDYDKMEVWCLRGKEEYPKELSSYTCLLKLYFTTQEKDKFFRTMNRLKESYIVLDNETLELIRTFS